MTTYRSLADRWRIKADILRRRGLSAQADVLETCAVELEEYERQLGLDGRSRPAPGGLGQFREG
jgi:hypothetical protein